MQYLAVVSFSGNLSMAKGAIREISDAPLADDLLRAGYIIPFEADKKKDEVKPKTKRKGKAE